MAYETEDDETQYCFPAVNSSCIKTKRSTHESNVMYVFFSLLSVWTVFLNLLVIISISHFKKLHTPTNLLILSLAVADMLVGLIVIPIEAIKLIETCWYFGDSFCGLFIFLLGLFLSASLSNLIFIAFDRFMAVIYPLLYTQRITMTKSLVAIFLTWFCSSSYITVIVVGNGYFDSDALRRSGVCYGECTFIFSFGWRVTDFFVTFLVPCAMIIILYLKIFYVAQRQVKAINSLVNRQKDVTQGSTRRKSDGKAALTLGIIVAIHLLCYVPIYIFALTGSTILSATTANFLTWTMYVSSAVNPLVYAFFYSWFRKALKHILTLKLFRPASTLVDVFTDYHS
ncbi:putative trace amine-associated receptor 13c-like [Triplophysa rosa]|uniref:Trace amine-associated receptor 13c-like n=1 Tax=Triplophysa rosa TaxID=992332 RepID=A0A9W7WD31_TRIRA|nr:putative trace amine-associated receptor 13c-like [Triplophysa rosa]